jgi:hypothetical protein
MSDFGRLLPDRPSSRQWLLYDRHQSFQFHPVTVSNWHTLAHRPSLLHGKNRTFEFFIQAIFQTTGLLIIQLSEQRQRDIVFLDAVTH